MPSPNDQSQSNLDDELNPGKRFSFRDYPSTGVVVLAALVSGLGWMVYKWSGGKRGDRPTAPNKPPDAENPALDNENAAAKPRRDRP